jgi:hypothetical protein
MPERVAKKGDLEENDDNTNFINIHLPNLIQSSSFTDINNTQQQPLSQIPPPIDTNVESTATTNNEKIGNDTRKEELKLPDSIDEKNYNLYYDKLLESYVNKQDNPILEEKTSEMLPLLSRRSRSENNNYTTGNNNNTNASKKLLVLEKHTLPAKTGYDMNSIGEHVLGAPLTNGFTSTQVNPGRSSELSYLNRNKLVNRRLTIRKHIENSSGLQAIIKPNSTYNKASSGFRIANPELLESMDNEEKAGKSGGGMESSTDTTYKASTTTSRMNKDASRQSLARAIKKSLIIVAEE